YLLRGQHLAGNTPRADLPLKDTACSEDSTLRRNFFSAMKKPAEAGLCVWLHYSRGRAGICQSAAYSSSEPSITTSAQNRSRSQSMKCRARDLLPCSIIGRSGVAFVM